MARCDGATLLYVTLSVRDLRWARDALSVALVFPEASAVMLKVDEPCQARPVEITALVKLCQAQGRAVLLGSDARFARVVGADGVHIPSGPDLDVRYRDARSILGTDATIGIDAGRSRHDAMTLGELGADYVAFGIPAAVQDRDRAQERRRDLVAWWSEIFEVPCVALDVASVDEAAELVGSGADFLEVAIPGGLPPKDVSRYLEGFTVAMRDTPGERAPDEQTFSVPGVLIAGWEKAP